MNKYIIEFTGTFFLTITLALTGNPLAFGGMYMAMVYMGCKASGGHYNPATTIAVWMQKKITARVAVFYILSQIFAAAAASLAFHFIYGRTRVFFISPDTRINLLKPLFIEGLFTFALIMVILYTSVAKSADGNPYYGLATGMAAIGLGYGAVNLSGGAFNPALGFVPVVVESILGICQCHPMHYAWIYLVGPITGSVAAGFLFRYVLKEVT